MKILFVIRDMVIGGAGKQLASDYEGIPNVIMKAFAMDVPVVSTDCSPGGARVLIDDGEYGFIVPVGDAKKLAQKMCSVVENECLAEKFIEKGKEKLKLFEPSSIFQKWNEYLKLCYRN